MTDLSQRLLAQYGGLRGLFRLDLIELARIRGVGDAKSVRVKAALELGRRLAVLSPDERPLVGSPEDVADLLGTEMAALEQEQLRWWCWIPSIASWARAHRSGQRQSETGVNWDPGKRTRPAAMSRVPRRTDEGTSGRHRWYTEYLPVGAVAAPIGR